MATGCVPPIGRGCPLDLAPCSVCFLSLSDFAHVCGAYISPFPLPPPLSCGFSRRSLSVKSLSTCGVLSSIIACVQWHNSRLQPTLAGSPSRRTGGGGGGDGRKSVVVLPRDAHKSAVHALVLSGAMPCFLAPVRHPESGVSLGVSTSALKAALKEHADQVLYAEKRRAICAIWLENFQPNRTRTHKSLSRPNSFLSPIRLNQACLVLICTVHRSKSLQGYLYTARTFVV